MRVLSLGLLAVLASCLRAGEFKCAANTDCDRGGVEGICQDVGYCSFADPGCASGQRFTDLSGSLSNTCVEGGSTFTIGGTISGLTGTVVLDDNGGDPLTTTASGPFTFSVPLNDGASYLVRVRTQPASQTCLISNDSGTVAGADVTDVTVTCGAVSTAEVTCSASAACNVGTEFCCFDSTVGSGVCQAGGQCDNQRVSCDSADDCGTNAVCCASYTMGGTFKSAQCKAAGSCVAAMGSVVEIWCDPAAGAGACGGGKTCTGTPMVSNPGYHTCQ